MRTRQRGYALTIMLVLLVMGCLYSVVSGLDSVQAKLGRALGTSAVLAQAREALLGYATTYRDSHSDQVFGYLPCPDTTGDGSADANIMPNATKCAAVGQTVVGLLPYKTLGLPDLRDSAGACLWYVVSGNFKAATTKSTPMNWDAQGQIAVLDANGNTVTTPDDANGGGAAVIIAVGVPITGQSRTSASGTVCNVTPSEVAAYLDGAYTFPNSGTVQLTQGKVSSDSNNDQFLYLTPTDIFARIRVRGDLASDLNTGIDAIQGKLNNAMSTYPPSSGNNLPASNPFTNGSSDYYFYANWKDNFRYLACSPVGSYCYSINGIACDGVLIFAGPGEMAGNGTTSPRPTNTRNSANYFETALALVDGTSSTIVNSLQNYSGTVASSDIVRCLTPAP